MSSHAPSPLVTDYCLVTPGFLTLTQPALPRHFSRILFLSAQGLERVRDPHNTFARLSVMHGMTEIYSATASFSPNMKAEMSLINVPENVSPVLDFPSGTPYQIYIHADVPCRVKLKIQHT